MPHNCPPDWVYVIGLGCVESMDAVYSFLTWSVSITIVVAGVAMAIGFYRRSENQRRDEDG